MDIFALYPGGFAGTTYLLCHGGDAVLIDCSSKIQALTGILERQGCTLRAILCTHGHFDHLLTADEVRQALHVPLYIHEADAEMLADSHKNAFSIFFDSELVRKPPEHTFRHGDVLTFGAITLRVQHTPGHSKGSSTLIGENFAFTGDTLFAGNVGRTDLYGGDAVRLRQSLQELSALPRDLTIYPGHGDSATLGEALDPLF